MQSVIVILALILFFIFIYGYASYSIEHHKKTKNLYIPLNHTEKDNNNDNKNIESFTVGGVNKDTCNASAKYGDDDFCLNGGNCISVSGTDGKTYKKCKCVKPFAGKHCKKNIGVQVKIHDNFTSPTVIERIPMFKREGNDYFIQDNDYL
tara:strand:+ start:16238 stop:16687 length:450 start_codon:yes stop_codon:yes gene_type:complete